MLEVGTFQRVLDRESADLSPTIDVKLSILVEIPRLDDAPGLELDVKGVLEVRNLHGSNERSKKALCDMLNPLHANHHTIWANPDRLEVSRELQMSGRGSSPPFASEVCQTTAVSGRGERMRAAVCPTAM
jgi:hypothetical protein